MSTTKLQIGTMFAERLKLALADCGLSQSQLAVTVGVSKASISKWTRGALPRAGELYRLAKALSVSMDWLFASTPTAAPTEAEADYMPLAQLPARKFAHALEASGLTLGAWQNFLDASVEGAISRRWPLLAKTAAGEIREISSMTLDKTNPLQDSQGGMSESLLRLLLRRVANYTQGRGTQSRLAREMGMSRQAVNNWLAGTAMPSAETALRLVQWVATEEATQTKKPGSVSSTPGPKTKKPKESK